MRILDILPLAALAAQLVGAAPSGAGKGQEHSKIPCPADGKEDRAKVAVDKLVAEAKARALKYVDAHVKKSRAQGIEPQCTREKIVYRKE